MTTTTILLFGIFVVHFIGATLGFALAQRRAARELARLWELVPEARLLRRASEYAGLVAFRDLRGFDSPGEDSVALRDLAARIGVAKTLDRRLLEMADQCITCMYYTLPVPPENVGAWCYMLEEPPVRMCTQWKRKD